MSPDTQAAIATAQATVSTASATWCLFGATVALVIVAIGALIASVFAAIYAYKAVIAANETLRIECKPVLVLTGSLEILHENQARNIDPPRNVFFLSPDISMMIDINPTIQTLNTEGRLYQHPAIFSRWTLTNSGRLPVVNITLTGEVKFYTNNSTNQSQEFIPNLTKNDKFFIRVPPLSPGEAYVFAMANLSLPAQYTFARKISVTQIDTEKTNEVTLFVSNDALRGGEGGIMPAVELPLASKPT